MNEDLGDTNQISKYNDAGLSISRLHEHWLRCSHFINHGNFTRWKTELDTIWLELYPDIIRQKDKKGLIKKNNTLMKNIAFSKGKTQLFFNLMQRHSFLREAQDLSGKAGVYVDENEEGFE